MPWSGPNLFAGLLFSSIGFVGFVYGKRMSAWKPMFIGLALMAYPYFIEDTIADLRHRAGRNRRAFLVSSLIPPLDGSLRFRIGLRPHR